MHKTILIAAALAVCATASSAASYYYGPDKTGCVAAPEGSIDIGDGRFVIGETVYQRVSKQQLAKDGSRHATYEVTAEDEIAVMCQKLYAVNSEALKQTLSFVDEGGHLASPPFSPSSEYSRSAVGGLILATRRCAWGSSSSLVRRSPGHAPRRPG